METQLTSPVTIETLPALHVACFRAVSPQPEEDGYEFMKAWIARQGLQEPESHFGTDCEVNEEQDKAGLRSYEQIWVVPEGVNGSEGVTIRELPGGLYAVMTLYHPFEAPFDRIPAGWYQLMDWVKASDTYKVGENQWLEELLPGSAGYNLKLYHPVAPK